MGMRHGQSVLPTASPAAGSLEALARSRFLERGGYQVVPQLFGRSLLLDMFDEATRLFPSALEELCEEDDQEDWRGGMPPRKLLNAGGGPAQDRLYQAPSLQLFLSEIIGVPVRPTSNRASYSYYCRTGDHLALHRDVNHCDISVIVAVSDNTGREESGGGLIVYPDRVHEPLSAIRRDPQRGAAHLKLAPGETLVLAGGMVPHLVRPVTAEQYRISAPMCFEVSDRGQIGWRFQSDARF